MPEHTLAELLKTKNKEESHKNSQKPQLHTVEQKFKYFIIWLPSVTFPACLVNPSFLLLHLGISHALMLFNVISALSNITFLCFPWLHSKVNNVRYSSLGVQKEINHKIIYSSPLLLVSNIKFCTVNGQPLLFSIVIFFHNFRFFCP